MQKIYKQSRQMVKGLAERKEQGDKINQRQSMSTSDGKMCGCIAQDSSCYISEAVLHEVGTVPF